MYRVFEYNSNTASCTVIDFAGPILVLCQCVRSSIRMFVMTKLAHNVKTTSYRRYQRRIQDAA